MIRSTSIMTGATYIEMYVRNCTFTYVASISSGTLQVLEVVSLLLLAMAAKWKARQR